MRAGVALQVAKQERDDFVNELHALKQQLKSQQ